MLKEVHLLVVMDANVCADRRGEGGVNTKVVGAYRWDALTDNRRRLVFSAENQLDLAKHVVSAPDRGMSHTIQSPNRWKARYRQHSTRIVDR